MEPVGVANLAQKLEILWRMSSLGSRSALAARFEMKESGIRYWETGDDARAPGLVPAARFPKLLSIVAEYMPGNRSEAEVKRLLLGQVGPFREAFLSNAEGNWEAFLELHGSRDALSLRQFEESTSLTRGPAELDIPQPDAIETIPRGARFRLDFAPGFRTAAPFWVFVLQFQNGIWDVLPYREGASIGETKGRNVVMPDQSQGILNYRITAAAQEEVRFAAVATRKPLPDEVRAAISQGNAIEGGRLDRLAYHLSNLDAGDRSVGLSIRYVT